MKKVLLLAIVLGLAAFTLYELLSKKEAKPEEKKEAPLTVGKHSDAFNTSFSQLMVAYYSLKDAFVDWDTVKINQAAISVQKNADSLHLEEWKADSTAVETARSYLSSIDGETKGLLGEREIEQKRRAFNMLSGELYDLIRTVRYDRETIYHIRCPMAFGDSAEAYWLSNSSKIVNPYLGKNHPSYKNKMLGCGELVDSLDFSNKQ